MPKIILKVYQTLLQPGYKSLERKTSNPSEASLACQEPPRWLLIGQASSRQEYVVCWLFNAMRGNCLFASMSCRVKVLLHSVMYSTRGEQCPIISMRGVVILPRKMTTRGLVNAGKSRIFI